MAMFHQYYLGRMVAYSMASINISSQLLGKLNHLHSVIYSILPVLCGGRTSYTSPVGNVDY